MREPNYKTLKYTKYTVTHCLVQFVLMVYCSLLANCDKTILNEIDNGSQVHTKNTLTELSGGRIIGEKWLRQMESPYFLQVDLNVERSGRLYIEPGVRVHVAPMVGITVRGVLNALVSNKYSIVIDNLALLLNLLK